MKRNQIRRRQRTIEKRIEELQQEYLELQRKDYLISTTRQWFTEEMEKHTISQRPKKVVEKLVGRIHWKERFYDGDYPGDKSKSIVIERTEVVRVNGEWV